MLDSKVEKPRIDPMNFRFYVLLTDAFTEKREWTDARALFARPGVPNPKPTASA